MATCTGWGIEAAAYPAQYAGTLHPCVSSNLTSLRYSRGERILPSPQRREPHFVRFSRLETTRGATHRAHSLVSARPTMTATAATAAGESRDGSARPHRATCRPQVGAHVWRSEISVPRVGARGQRGRRLYAAGARDQPRPPSCASATAPMAMKLTTLTAWVASANAAALAAGAPSATNVHVAAAW